MIASYRDRKTEQFTDGKHVKEFSSFARQAESRLERLDAATSLKDLGCAARQQTGRTEGQSAGPIQHPH
jgi:proteic killer suppression protein